MSDSALETVRNEAKRAAASRLRQAASFAMLHAGGTGVPLFQKTMKRPGTAPVVVRLDWPGVLRVFDFATGDLLAESEPGQLTVLKAGCGPISYER